MVKSIFLIISFLLVALFAFFSLADSDNVFLASLLGKNIILAGEGGGGGNGGCECDWDWDCSWDEYCDGCDCVSSGGNGGCIWDWECGQGEECIGGECVAAGGSECFVCSDCGDCSEWTCFDGKCEYDPKDYDCNPAAAKAQCEILCSLEGKGVDSAGCSADGQPYCICSSPPACECDWDWQCGWNEYCDGCNCQTSDCTWDWQCGWNEYCDNGQCVSCECSGDWQCGWNESCDGCTCQVQVCTSHSYQSCSGSDLYWFDSCGNQEGKAQDCSDTNSCTEDGCSGGSCYNNLICNGSTCALGTPDYCTSCSSCGDGECNCGETVATCSQDCNTPPEASNLSYTPDFAQKPVPYFFNWDYFDADGDPQFAYEIQVDLDTGDFSTPEAVKYLETSSQSTYLLLTSSPGPEDLAYNKDYKARVIVWDDIASKGDPSSPSPVLDLAPTPPHPYPDPSFDLTPLEPKVGQEVQFTDSSIAYGGSNIIDWLWTFQDPDGNVIGSSDQQDPVFTFTQPGQNTVILNVTDSDGLARESDPITITVESWPIIEWQEIAPY